MDVINSSTLTEVEKEVIKKYILMWSDNISRIDVYYCLQRCAEKDKDIIKGIYSRFGSNAK